MPCPEIFVFRRERIRPTPIRAYGSLAKKAHLFNDVNIISIQQPGVNSIRHDILHVQPAESSEVSFRLFPPFSAAEKQTVRGTAARRQHPKFSVYFEQKRVCAQWLALAVQLRNDPHDIFGLKRTLSAVISIPAGEKSSVLFNLYDSVQQKGTWRRADQQNVPFLYFPA